MPAIIDGTNGITTPSPVVLNGATSGSITLAAPAVAGSSVITFPVGTGTASVNGLSSNIVSGTAVASTSGTSITFTGIPSWVRRITVMLNAVSGSGTSNIIVQLGAGSIEATSYSGSASASSGTNATTFSLQNSTGFLIAYDTSNAVTRSAIMTIALVGSNVWVSSVTSARTDAAGSSWGAGSKTLSGTLDRVRITTVNGTDTFDAGSVNILYE